MKLLAKAFCYVYFHACAMCMHYTNKYGPTFENIAAAGVVVQTSTGYIDMYFKKFT